jgi:hypothetical protein
MLPAASAVTANLTNGKAKAYAHASGAAVVPTERPASARVSNLAALGSMFVCAFAGLGRGQRQAAAGCHGARSGDRERRWMALTHTCKIVQREYARATCDKERGACVGTRGGFPEGRGAYTAWRAAP